MKTCVYIQDSSYIWYSGDATEQVCQIGVYGVQLCCIAGKQDVLGAAVRHCPTQLLSISLVYTHC